jgi:single-stranded-DNA-specific exonuclease
LSLSDAALRAASVQASEPSAAALGVERSLTGRRWALTPTDERLAAALSQRHGLSEIVGRVLASRGVSLDGVESFLAPKLRELLPDPRHLKDMRIGAERLAAAITGDEEVAVFGDYDVDGATAAALLLRFLAATGARRRLYVPDRLREGYGPNAPALLALREQGVSLVVTVDCGIAAHDALGQAVTAGLDVIVVDHHQGRDALPPATAVINPKRLDEDGTLSHLAAVGVAFLLIVDVNRLLRAAGWYGDRPEPDLRQWLDLVALGTVCDLVPLTGVNRAFVTQGLRIMHQRRNPGLRALADAAGLSAPPAARDLGFAIGPRINAGGRVGEAALGARLLSTDDPAEAVELARRLDAFNRERQAIEQAVLDEALQQVAAGPVGPLIWAAGTGWHPGVVGIVASRLVERYHRPAVVVSLDGEHGVASGRSVPGFDLGGAVNEAAAAGLLVKGGGHAMAAGFTAEAHRLEALREFISARLTTAEEGAGPVPALAIDGVLSLAGAAGLPRSALDALAPFGPGHREPRFAIADARIGAVREIAGRHLGCTLLDGAGARLQAIAFRTTDGPLGRALTQHAGAPFHFAGRLQPQRGTGRALQLIIDDAASALGG